MKNIYISIYRNRYFVLFVFLFAYVQSIYMRIAGREQITMYTFTPESAFVSLFSSALLFVILLTFLKKWQRAHIFSTKEILVIFGSSIFTYVLTMAFFGFLVALVFNNVERNFNKDTLVYTVFNQFLDGFIYGSFFLAYYYYNRNKKHQLELYTYNTALAESKIKQLKAQLNPHFLFNNLNVLDQLIEEDKNMASVFLNEFAEIYRYVLQATDKKIVSLSTELSFARQYFNIIRHKYGTAYQLSLTSNNTKGTIAPLTLQLLIENAVQHNIGTPDKPILIEIQISDNISVSNNIIFKENTKPTKGRALHNLKEQYKLLTEIPIEIYASTEKFTVIIPII